MNLKEKVKGLPSSSGVYLMKDAAGSVIYVGKSKNLKSRVGSYFLNSKAHPPKVVKLVKHLKDFDYILTDTEFEAFMLECKLIKELRPLYNRVMKNQRSYCYIRINRDGECPNISITEESDKNDGNIYFGPYTSRNTVERGLQGIREFFKILCSWTTKKASSCLNHSLGLCLGPCMPDYPKEQYLETLDKVANLLEGSDKSIIKTIENSMKNASELLDFESAAKFRDYLSAIHYLVGKAKVIDYTEKNKNIVVLEPISDESVKCFFIKGNKVLFSERYFVEKNNYISLNTIIKANIPAYFNNIAPKAPIRIGCEEIDEAQIIYSYLNSKYSSCSHVILPERWLKTPDSEKLDNRLYKLLQSFECKT